MSAISTNRFRRYGAAVRRVLALMLLTLVCALAPRSVFAQEETGHTLVIAVGEQVAGDVATLSQPIEVAGEVLGDVTSWSGDVHVRGHVAGDVVSYVGNVLLDPGARVDGNVLSLAGALLHAEGAQVAGQALGDPVGNGPVANLLGLFQPQISDAAGVVARAGFSLSFLLVILALATIGALLYPRRTRGVSTTFLLAPGRSLTLGLITTALLGLLLVPAGALLALTLLGLPLLLPLLLVLHVPYIAGIAALGQALGQRLTAVQPERATALGVFMLLIPAVLVGPFAPVLALLLFYLIAGTGLGAAILSRGGALAPVTVRREV